ncbi:MAG: hypothetical protein RQ723_00950 [Desulfuromonadales bacterium]|nr:hypothetical protein [Desulfuromonadales bacterium]
MNRKVALLALVAVGILSLPVVLWAAADPADPHRMIANSELQETIEGRCTACHSRDRVDQALDQGEDLETLLQKMIERGAVLNERDRSVLGTFWGSPVSGDRQPGN